MLFYIYWTQGHDLDGLEGPLEEGAAKKYVENLLQNGGTARVLKGFEVEIVPVATVTKVEFKWGPKT